MIAELAKLHAHCSLRWAWQLCCLGQAVAGYRAALDDWEQVLRHRVSRAAETTVLPTLRQLTMSHSVTHTAADEVVVEATSFSCGICSQLVELGGGISRQRREELDGRDGSGSVLIGMTLEEVDQPRLMPGARSGHQESPCP